MNHANQVRAIELVLCLLREEWHMSEDLDEANHTQGLALRLEIGLEQGGDALDEAMKDALDFLARYHEF